MALAKNNSGSYIIVGANYENPTIHVNVEEFGGNVSENFPIPDATYWNVWWSYSVIDPMTSRALACESC